MALTDFLFNGNPPSSITSFQQSNQALPPWYESYITGIMAKSNAVAGVPSSDYFANRPPQVAGCTQDQNDAFAQTRANNS